MIKFERISKYKNIDVPMPCAATASSAGYDLAAVEDIVIPSYHKVIRDLISFSVKEQVPVKPLELRDVAALTRTTGVKPTLVSTGLKCQLEEGTYLKLVMRSSTPLKYWLVMANAQGIIDADYYNNADNEGEIFLQVINFSPFDIQIRKGDVIAQGIITPYLTLTDDARHGERKGGFGSTSK